MTEMSADKLIQIWFELRAEAEGLARGEPMLASFSHNNS